MWSLYKLEEFTDKHYGTFLDWSWRWQTAYNLFSIGKAFNNRFGLKEHSSVRSLCCKFIWNKRGFSTSNNYTAFFRRKSNVSQRTSSESDTTIFISVVYVFLELSWVTRLRTTVNSCLFKNVLIHTMTLLPYIFAFLLIKNLISVICGSEYKSLI